MPELIGWLRQETGDATPYCALRPGCRRRGLVRSTSSADAAGLSRLEESLMQIRTRAQGAAACEMTLTLALAAVLAVAVGTAPAQHQFMEPGKRHLPADTGQPSAAVFGDVDGDGDLDLVTGGTASRLFLNDGTGVFRTATSAQMPAGFGGFTSMVLADADADGDPDLLIGTETGRLYLLVNDGRGTFTDASYQHVPATSDTTVALTVGDVDRDGDLDLVVGNWGHAVMWPSLLVPEPNRLYLNIGSGNFVADPTRFRLPNLGRFTTALVLGDIDGDGDLDLVIGNGNRWHPGPAIAQQNELYLNDGSGVFADATAARLPVSVGDTRAVAAGDVDGDGDLDLIFGGDGEGCLYLNDGTGNLTDATAARMPPFSGCINCLALGDVDGDGDLDLLAGVEGQNQLYLNDASGRFTDASSSHLPDAVEYTAGLALGDVDADGALDLMVANLHPQQSHLFLNDRGGVFTDAASMHLPPFGGGSYELVALGDVDLDGDADLIVAIAGRPHLLRNDGRGTMRDDSAGHLVQGSIAWQRGGALGDVDGDGDLDLLISAQQHRLHLNDGSGTFTDATATNVPVTAATPRLAVLFDADGDHDLDLLVGSQFSSQDRLYRNDGSGRFTDATAGHLPAWSGSTESIVAGDIDGDGDLDLLVGVLPAGGPGNRLLLNDGIGTFTDATAGRWSVSTTDWTKALVLADFDGDGDLDLATGNAGQQNRLFLNNGSGSFQDVTNLGAMPLNVQQTYALVAGDADGDGDLDLVIGNFRQQDRLYRNNGSGTFTDVSARMPPDVEDTLCLLAGDLDGDGDLDLVRSSDNINARPRLHVNLLRHLGAPWLLRAGETWRLDVYSRGSPSAPFDLALPCLSFAAARIPLPPLGTLGLDPNVMLPLPGLLIPQPAGDASLPLPIPNLPGLAGVRIHTQALLLLPQQARFTNVVAEAFLR